MIRNGKKSNYTDLGAIQFKRLRKGSIEWCSNEHSLPQRKDTRSPNAGSRKNAAYEVSILGIPTAYLCSKCKKEWVEIYKKYSSRCYDD